MNPTVSGQSRSYANPVCRLSLLDLSFMVAPEISKQYGPHLARADLSHRSETSLHRKRHDSVATPNCHEAGAVLRLFDGLLADGLRHTNAGHYWPAGGHRALATAGRSASTAITALLLGPGPWVSPAPPSQWRCRLASQWYRRSIKAKAMGIAGAGNRVPCFAALFAPGLAYLFGWQNVFGSGIDSGWWPRLIDLPPTPVLNKFAATVAQTQSR